MAAQLSSATTVLNSWHQISSSSTPLVFFKAKAYPNNQRFYPCRRTATVTAATEGSAKKQSKSTKEEDDDSAGTPSWAKTGSDELPPWAQKDSSGIEVPFFVYLLASAVGSIFEYVNEKPECVAPVLGFFVFTGIPSSAFLWFKLLTKRLRNKTRGMDFVRVKSLFLVAFV